MLAVFPNYVFNKNFFEIFTVVSPILLAHQLKIIVNLLLNKDVAKTDMLKAFTLLILSVIFIRLLTVVLENIKRVFTDNHNELINHNIDKQILIKINDLEELKPAIEYIKALDLNKIPELNTEVIIEFGYGN